MKINTALVMACTVFVGIAGCSSVSTALPQVLPVPTAIPTVSPVPTATFYVGLPDMGTEIDTWLEGQIKQGRFTGAVLVADKDGVLLSKGYGLSDRANGIPNTPQTRFRLGSVTKQFTATAILILQSQGKLDVQDHICDYLDECPEPWGDITIHHLLTHTSGIPDFLQLNNYVEARVKSLKPEKVIALFKDRPLIFSPGERFSYSNSGYIVLGYIIERTSGMTYEEFLQQSIFIPLDMQNTGYEHPSSKLAVGYFSPYPPTPVEFIDMSVPYAAGSLYSTVEDLYLWDQVLYTEQLLPQELLDQMFTPHVQTDEGVGSAYGYGWSVGEENGHPIHVHGGGVEGFRSVIARYPEDRLVIIVLSNQESTDMMSIQRKIASIIFGSK